MADWGGFTEDDLRELNYPGKIIMGKPPGGSPKKQANFGKQKGKNANKDRAFGQKKRVTLSDVVEVMPVDQMLNPSSVSNGDAGSPTTDGNNEAKPSPAKPKNTTTPPKSVLKPSKPIERHGSRSNSHGNDGKLHDDISLNNTECSRELDEKEALSRELSQIQKFQHQQKLIEDKNKQTKILLAQAIKERRARAETEAHLLTDLQKELSRLDNLLTNDVSIIRDRIESSSLEYTESQKRYEKAEKEFVDAKMELYRRAETKEKLTEHLYTIIYQNEMRKAQKLSELMEMLALTTAGEEVECILPAIPPIPMYNPVQTLYSPSKSTQATKDAAMGNHDGSESSKPETCGDQKSVDQSVGSDVPNESNGSLSKGSDVPSESTSKGSDVPNESNESTSKGSDVPNESNESTSKGSDVPNESNESTSKGSDVPNKSNESTSKGSDIPNESNESTSKGSDVPNESNESTSKGSDVPKESNESTSKGSASSMTTEEGHEKQTDTDMPGAANGDIPSSSQNSLPSETSEVKGAADPSVESEAARKDCENKEHGASSGGWEIPANYSIPETSKISSSLQTNLEDERTNKDKKTTLKELAQ